MHGYRQNVKNEKILNKPYEYMIMDKLTLIASSIQLWLRTGGDKGGAIYLTDALGFCGLLIIYIIANGAAIPTPV